ncbi:hypothetical protein BS50DRAFT_568065 [Corynespora cassiicola Philippines]|uniref:Capsule polysaccharide biosynthesis protein n=1 Tax=Corynespora cassiicola Philippines TaxID=1448308 RepID=A0A2T2PCJ6_CORCC|nr:hypothetical protein BS50DRAFT_568065 [Corynespora cassiicola Philippines]
MDYPDILNTKPLAHSVSADPSAGDKLPPALTHPHAPTRGSKHIFAFWDSGLESLPPYLKRNILSWYKRYSPLGWTIYVLDNITDSPRNVSNFLDTTSRSVVPLAFTQRDVNGTYSAQHTSDLIRYPLLLRYGGVYLDVGILQFGDLDWIWTQHIANPSSPYDFAGFTMGDAPELSIVNFSFMAAADNPLVERAHRILLKMWEGKSSTAGMHGHPLVAHVPLLRVPQEVEVDDEASGKMKIDDERMTDYAIQIQAMGAAQRWVDDEEGWDGPKYVREKAWLLSMLDGAFVHEQMTSWSGQKQFDLLSMDLPAPGDEETAEQALARKVVEGVVGKSWCLKLSHGISAKLFGGDTLGMLWRKYDGSDNVDGTYGGWLRWAQVNRTRETPPEPMRIPVYEPTMRGRIPELSSQ